MGYKCQHTNTIAFKYGTEMSRVKRRVKGMCGINIERLKQKQVQMQFAKYMILFTQKRDFGYENYGMIKMHLGAQL